MLVCVIHEPGRIALDQRPDPDCPPGHALVAIKTASICGTDVHMFDGTIPVQLPRVPGHDCAGLVVEGAGGVAPGTRVLVRPSFPCRDCEACTRAAFDECRIKKLIGLHSDGAMQELLAVPVGNLLPLPDDVSLAAAANLEPFTVALNMTERLQLRLDELVVILGQGPIGLALTRLAASSGCRVLATDMRESRLKLARAAGALRAVDAREDVLAAVGELSADRGAEVVVEASGSAAAAGLLLPLVAKEGRIGLIGYRPDIGALDIASLIMKTLTVVAVGGNGGRGRYDQAIALLRAREISLDGIVTHMIAVERVQEAFSLAAEADPDVGRITLDFEQRRVPSS